MAPPTTTTDLSRDVPLARNYQDRNISPRFGDFVTRNDQYYKHVARIRQNIKTYIRKHRPKRPLNILLAAPPGAGKSFLIKQIIKALQKEQIKTITGGSFTDASFEEIYISALDSSDELFAMFRRIQSLNLEYKIPVVFFDEIDSPINGRTVYSKLLAPMWDGQFYIGKEKFLLGPAVFFFAGSGLSCEAESERILSGVSDTIRYDDYCQKWKEDFKNYVAAARPDEKLPDFVDRLDSILRIPPISKKFLGDETQAELEDVVCMLIRKHFEDANYIGKTVLDQLSKQLTEPNSIREVEKLIFSSAPPSDNHFDIYRLPSADPDKVEFEPDYWSIQMVPPSGAVGSSR